MTNNYMTNNYLLNAFSLQMIPGDATIHIQELDKLPDNLISAIGHQDTANVLGVKFNRINVSLNYGDIAYVVQLVGGRLPEGATELPDGFKFKYYKITVEKINI